MNRKLTELSPIWVRDGFGAIKGLVFQCPRTHFGAHFNKHPIIIYTDNEYSKLTGVNSVYLSSFDLETLSMKGLHCSASKFCVSAFEIENGVVKFNADISRPSVYSGNQVRLI